MGFNQETFWLMLKFGGAMIGILLLIWLIAVGTPYAAKLVDKLLGKLNINTGESSVPDADGEKDGKYTVYDIYEGVPSVADDADNAENGGNVNADGDDNVKADGGDDEKNTDA